LSYGKNVLSLYHRPDCAALPRLVNSVTNRYRQQRCSKAQGRRRDGGRGPGLYPGVHFRRTRPWLISTGEWRAEGSSLDSTPASLSVTVSTSYLATFSAGRKFSITHSSLLDSSMTLNAKRRLSG